MVQLEGGEMAFKIWQACCHACFPHRPEEIESSKYTWTALNFEGCGRKHSTQLFHYTQTNTHNKVKGTKLFSKQIVGSGGAVRMLRRKYFQISYMLMKI